MNEEQKEKNISVPMPSDNNIQNIIPVKSKRLKYWIVLSVVLVFIIGGYFIWKNYLKKGAMISNSLVKSGELYQICDKIKTPWIKGRCIEQITIKAGLDNQKVINNCEKIPHSTWEKNTSRDDCFLGALSTTNYSWICDKILDDLNRRSMCYIIAAKISGDDNLCQKLDYNYVDNWCMGKASEILLCRQWDTTAVNTYAKKRIYDERKQCLAYTTRNEKDCELLGDEYSKKVCFIEVNVLNKNLSYCDNIKETAGNIDSNSCYEKMSIVLDDASLCEKVKYKDSCYANLAGTNHHQEVCEKIIDDLYKKDSCYLQVVDYWGEDHYW